MRWARGKLLIDIPCNKRKKLWWRTADECFYISNVGDCYSAPPGVLDQEPDEDWVRSRENEGRAYQEWDEDADVDESGEVLSAANNVDHL